jgi:hypothetical protein
MKRMLERSSAIAASIITGKGAELETFRGNGTVRRDLPCADRREPAP